MMMSTASLPPFRSNTRPRTTPLAVVCMVRGEEDALWSSRMVTPRSPNDTKDSPGRCTPASGISDGDTHDDGLCGNEDDDGGVWPRRRRRSRSRRQSVPGRDNHRRIRPTEALPPPPLSPPPTPTPTLPPRISVLLRVAVIRLLGMVQVAYRCHGYAVVSLCGFVSHVFLYKKQLCVNPWGRRHCHEDGCGVGRTPPGTRVVLFFIFPSTLVVCPHPPPSHAHKQTNKKTPRTQSVLVLRVHGEELAVLDRPADGPHHHHNDHGGGQKQNDHGRWTSPSPTDALGGEPFVVRCAAGANSKHLVLEGQG
jgi:hypothetical protein